MEYRVNRYVFRYNKEYMDKKFPNSGSETWYESWPTGLMDSTRDINFADNVLFPPKDWQQMELEGKGKIVRVIVTIKEIENGN